MSIAMQTSPTLLIIEDDPDNARSVDEAAQDAGFITHCAATGLAGVEAFEQQMPDLVLSDLVLPDIDGLQVLARLRKLDAAVPVIIMTAYGSVESGVRAMREGAYDYVTKPLDLDDIQSKLRRAYEASRLRRQVNKLSQTVREKYASTAIIAESAAMQTVIKQIEALADTMATILIRGESGTGRSWSLAPTLIPSAGRPSWRSTVVPSPKPVGVGAVRHEKGVHWRDRHAQGRVRARDGGTPFSMRRRRARPVQVKLLRARRERGTARRRREVFKVNAAGVRHQQGPRHHGARGNFPRRLFYRLNVVTPAYRAARAQGGHPPDG